MVVRIRLRSDQGSFRQDVALAISSLLMAIALLTFTWTLCDFEVESFRYQTASPDTGFASRRQIWLVVSAALSLAAYLLGNYGSNKNAHLAKTEIPNSITDSLFAERPILKIN